MVGTRSRTAKLNPFASSFEVDKCGSSWPFIEKCNVSNSDDFEIDKVGHKMYDAMVGKVIKACTPYNGKRVFIVNKNVIKHRDYPSYSYVTADNMNVAFVCPDFTLTLGKKKLSVSFAKRGYFYVHFLKDSIKEFKNCIYSGNHLTIGPAGEKDDEYVHFHVTQVNYEIDYDGNVVYASSHNASFCTVKIEDVKKIVKNKKLSKEGRKEKFAELVCVNKYGTSFNKDVREMLRKDDDMVDIVFDIFSL